LAGVVTTKRQSSSAASDALRTQLADILVSLTVSFAEVDREGQPLGMVCTKHRRLCSVQIEEVS